MLIALAAFVAGAAAAPATAFRPVPIFEVPVGENSPESLGKDIDEEKITDYEKFYFPASFNVFEKLGLVLVLDSNRGRICRYDLKGRFLGAVDIPFRRHAIDFAWAPSAGGAFFAFQEGREIGFWKIDFGSPDGGLKPFKYFSVPDVMGKKDVKDFGVQRIWASGACTGAGTSLLLNVNSDQMRDVAISYADGKVGRIMELPKDFGAACAFGKTGGALDLAVVDSSVIMRTVDFSGGDSDWVELMKELVPKPGAGVKNIRLVGTDGQDNAYVEALYGPAEDAINDDYVYKFSRNGRFLGRARIPKSPEMLVNRFIFVDAGGAIFYMRKSDDMKKIQFFRFEINEFN